LQFRFGIDEEIDMEGSGLKFILNMKEGKLNGSVIGI
jgi:hypothetical protein